MGFIKAAKLLLLLTRHLSEQDRGPIASSGGSSVNVFAAARPATEAQNAGCLHSTKGSSTCPNRGSNFLPKGDRALIRRIVVQSLDSPSAWRLNNDQEDG
jgi:hypothetical protein